ncbi:MAG: hypothetical protein HOP22_04760 [Nitrospiraceae bacterium]|nr:hypothetical protein [Nitrospiraceae bacterium]
MNRLLKDNAGLFQPRAHVRNVTLSCLIQTEGPTWLRGDSVRLRQILSHLLNNALTFTAQAK